MNHTGTPIMRIAIATNTHSPSGEASMLAAADRMARCLRHAIDRAMRFLIHNRAHTCGASLAAAWAWSVLLGAEHPSLLVLLPAPMVMAAVYQWNRLTDWREDRMNAPHETRTAISHRYLIRCTAFSLGLAGLLLALASAGLPAALVLSTVAGLGAVYGVRLPCLALRPKQVPLAKNAIACTGWVAATVVFPALALQCPRHLGFAVALAAMWFLVWGVELYWDMRDVIGDSAVGIVTIPVFFGVRPTAACLALGAVAGSGLLFAAVAYGALPHHWIVVAPVPLMFVPLAVDALIAGVAPRWAAHTLVTALIAASLMAALTVEYIAH